MQYILVVIFLFIGAVESVRYRKLTLAGAVAGGLIGFFVFAGARWTGEAMLAAFFLFGTLATSWKRKQKELFGMAQEKGGRRNIGQVLANGGVGGLLGLLTLFFPQHQNVLRLMMAGAFSSAMADTLSSELGSLYGKRFYNILTFQKDRRGLDGVISFEGTLIGIFGSIFIAMIYGIGFGWSKQLFWIVIAGTIGNLIDSLLGATLERKKMISNDVVNFSNTGIAAVIALLLF
ncbi:MAG TPA: DUF92 domain-containing protein [Flavisolibacter sp.]|nr:DUF92 domain-containing protein [Flavisolibacter sp.]